MCNTSVTPSTALASNITVHSVSLHVLITMKLSAVVRLVTAAISVALPILSSCAYCFVRGGRASSLQSDPSDDSTIGDAEIRTCDRPGEGLKLNGAETVFQFRCPEGAKLEPVEQVSRSGPGLTDEELKKVFVFTPSNRETATECVRSPEKLDQLVPRSELEVVQKGKSKLPEEGQTGEPVFRLTVGPAPDAEKYLCYTCVTPAAQGHTPATKCNIYVSVPGKEDQAPPPAEPETNQPSGSVSSSPSMLGWLMLSVAGCASAATHL